jgi:hypothetical protein
MLNQRLEFSKRTKDFVKKGHHGSSSGRCQKLSDGCHVSLAWLLPLEVNV